jgi:hypothetical protein
MAREVWTECAQVSRLLKGHGYGDGYGHGHGYGYGNGNGYGGGHGYGDGYGGGHGHGDGDGNGDGNGDGFPEQELGGSRLAIATAVAREGLVHATISDAILFALGDSK